MELPTAAVATPQIHSFQPQLTPRFHPVGPPQGRPTPNITPGGVGSPLMVGATLLTLRLHRQVGQEGHPGHPG